MSVKFQFYRAAAKTSFVATPIMFVQAMRLRRSIPRLPEAAGPRRGSVLGIGNPVRLLFFGESTAAGVGTEWMEDSIGGQWARRLNKLTGRTVEWTVIGRNGATAETALRNLVPQLRGLQVDVVGTALGGNDIMQLNSAKGWERDLGLVLDGMRDAIGDDVPIIWSGMPPIGQFPALPLPLRGMLGFRGKMLNLVTQRVVSQRDNLYMLNDIISDDPAIYSSDDFHPGTLGYKLWGEALAELTVSAELLPQSEIM